MNEQHKAELDVAAKWPERAIWFLALACITWALIGCGSGEEDEPSHPDRLPVTCPGEACK